MGKAFSCCLRFNTEDHSQANERTRLLRPKETRTNSFGIDSNLEIICENLDLIDSSISCNNNDLPSIEDKMNRDMINVRDMDHPIEKSEWNRRTKLYERRLSRINKPLLLRSTLMSETLEEEPVSVHKFCPIDEEDLELITYLSEKASQAVLNGFKIQSKDSVVVKLKSWT